LRLVRAVTLILLIAGCGAAATPSAPAQKNQDPLNRDTPQSAVFSFLEACRAKDYAKAWRYLDLRRIPQDKRADQGPQLAQQLEHVLDRDPGFDVASLSHEKDGSGSDGLPRDTELVDTFTVDGKSQQLTLEHTTLRSGVQIWLFAPDSVVLIPKLAAMATGSPIDRYLPPQLVNWTLIDTPLWRWIAMVLLAVVLALLSRWIARLALFIADALICRTRLKLEAQLLRSFVGPFQLLFPLVMFRAAYPALGLAALLRLALQHVCGFLLAVGIAWLCFRLIDVFLSGLRAFLAARKRQLPYSTMSLVSRMLKLTVLVFALTTLLGDWGYNTSTILAGLGVGGIAIALAAQKTIENLFGGVAVISDRPVRVGDYCRFGNNSGTVEDIGLRSTRIRTADRTLVTVPNGEFSAMMLENFNRRDKMLFHIMLNLRRDTSPEQVREVLESVSQTLKQHPKIEQGGIPVRFTGIGSYSLDLEVFVYVLTLDGDEFIRMQQELLLTILDEVAAAGTALALPTQASIAYSPMERTPAAEKGEPQPAHNGRH
jgi:MscS family membrane protein